LCKAVLGCNTSIQEVEIITKSGVVLEKFPSQRATGNRTGAGNNRPCLLEISLGDEFDDLYGPIQYHFSHGNASTFTFPFGNYLVVVTATKSMGPISLATKIARVITRFC